MTRKKMVAKDGSGARKYNTIPGIAKINQILSSILRVFMSKYDATDNIVNVMICLRKSMVSGSGMGMKIASLFNTGFSSFVGIKW
ncbi:hypothetical protein [Candidatus Nitrosotalea okcheonensis]|nr:hypothetical protein [Candidatus Nitrosotalea okcheonensis]